MPQTLICLVGDQTVPNVLLIKDPAFRQIQQYLFITTEQMEQRNRLEHIVNATGIHSYKKLIVKADDLQDIKSNLDQLQLPVQDTTYFVNLTSGTKLMSIALYDYFTKVPYPSCSRILYMPIGKNAFISMFAEASRSKGGGVLRIRDSPVTAKTIIKPSEKHPLMDKGAYVYSDREIGDTSILSF